MHVHAHLSNNTNRVWQYVYYTQVVSDGNERIILH